MPGLVVFYVFCWPGSSPFAIAGKQEFSDWLYKNTDWLENFIGGCMWKRKGLRTAAVESGAAESVAAAAWIRF